MNPNLRCWQGRNPSESSRGEQVICFFQLLMAPGILMLQPDHSNLCFQVTLPPPLLCGSVSKLPLPLSCKDMCDCFWAHPDNPEQTLPVKILNLITSLSRQDNIHRSQGQYVDPAFQDIAFYPLHSQKMLCLFPIGRHDRVFLPSHVYQGLFHGGTQELEKLELIAQQALTDPSSPSEMARQQSLPWNANKSFLKSKREDSQVYTTLKYKQMGPGWFHCPKNISQWRQGEKIRGSLSLQKSPSPQLLFHHAFKPGYQ